MTKICFVISSLRQGGAERALVELANHMSAENSVTILNFDDEPSYFSLNPSIAVRTIGNAKRPAVGRSMINFVRRFAMSLRIIGRSDPDVIISFLDVTTVNVLLWNLVLRKPLIVSEHCNPADSLLSPFQKRIRKHLYKRATAMVNPTRDAFSIFESLGVPLPRIQRVIRNPLPADLTPATPPPSNGRRNVLLFVGRLSPEKQVDHLIDIFKTADLQDWELHLIGDGPERQRLEAYAAKHCGDTSRIKFLGHRLDLMSHYQSAKLLALTSRTEGLSNVILEAMANGCVCISYDCKVGPAELIEHDIDGILIPPQRRDLFVTALTALAGNDATIARLRQSAQGIVATVHRVQIAQQWADLMQDVIAASAPAVPSHMPRGDRTDAPRA